MLQDLFNQISTLNVISGKDDCMKQLQEWADKMHTQIDEKYNELQMKINHVHTKIEASRDHWKASLRQNVETNVGCVLQVQSQKDEVDENEFKKARAELHRLNELFQFLNHKPLIFMSNGQENRHELNAPSVFFSNIDIDIFGWMENNFMEYTHQQQIDVDENITDQRDNGEYNRDSN